MNGSTINGSTARGMGWIPDLPSVKDYTPATPAVALPRVVAATTPARVDLRPQMPAVEDQGDIGSCTAHAGVALVEYMERRASGRHIDASRLFVYYVTRYLLGWIGDGDTGAYLRTTMGALALFGAPPEQYWPYDEKKVNRKPDPECYALGQSYQSLTYFRLDENRVSGAALLDSIRKRIKDGFPVMFGFTVYDEFMEPVRRDHPSRVPFSFVPFPGRSSREQGGHAIVACGYDDELEMLLIRNSWGEGWGDAGYAWMDYRYVLEGVADDFWCVTKQEWIDTGNFGAG